MAIADLLGSNATNMALLLPIDAAYSGHLLSDANPAVAMSAMAAIVLMAVGIGAIVLKAERRRMPFDPAAAMLLVVYVLGLALVYDATG